MSAGPLLGNKAEESAGVSWRTGVTINQAANRKSGAGVSQTTNKEPGLDSISLLGTDGISAGTPDVETEVMLAGVVNLDTDSETDKTLTRTSNVEQVGCWPRQLTQHFVKLKSSNSLKLT